MIVLSLALRRDAHTKRSQFYGNDAFVLVAHYSRVIAHFSVRMLRMLLCSAQTNVPFCERQSRRTERKVKRKSLRLCATSKCTSIVPATTFVYITHELSASIMWQNCAIVHSKYLTTHSAERTTASDSGDLSRELTRKEYQHREQQHTEQNHNDGGAFPCATRRQTFAKVQRCRVVMRWGAAHGAARRQHRPRVAAIVALQRVFGGRRTRRPAFVFDR